MPALGEQIRHWFDLAADLPPNGRRRFLDSNCPYTAVRSEVLSLLEFDEGDLSRVPYRPVSATLVEQAIAPDLAPAPQRVGPFELGKLLGAGGMGFVYEAHRVDGEVRQRVAIKFAQVSPAASFEFRESANRRFCRERQILASLRHPYIAGLIDAGTTSEGIPYAAIEQVDGVPVDVYCDSHGLSQTERIELVLKLCEAVQFAHRNLIVHSDIKPDNVLVTAGGIPKLIDFGVASDLSEDSNLTGMRAFTPGYASPEQSRGLPATVATDVYGLGALLYRLLTGSKPRDTRNAPMVDVIRHIAEEDVIRPSRINPALKGDLENILLHALQREPNRRYGSVPEFAADLERFLAQRPVRATPDSVPYRASRFLRRHRLPAATFAALVMGLGIAAFVFFRQRDMARHQEAEMRRIAQRLLFEVHDEIGLAPGATKAREKLSATAVEYLERLEQNNRRDPELQWDLLNAYGRLALNQAGSAFSTGDIESGLRFALKTLALAPRVESSSLPFDRRDRLFTIYESLASVFQEASRPQEELQAIEGMLRLARGLTPVRQAQAYKTSGRYHESPPAGHRLDRNSAIKARFDFDRAVTILRTIAGAAGTPPDAESQLASALMSLGRIRGLMGDVSGSVSNLEEGVRLSEASFAAQPHNAKIARRVYWGTLALADAFAAPSRFHMDRPADAAMHYRRAQAVAANLLAADPGNEMAKLDLARAYGKHASAIGHQNPREALDLLDRALTLTPPQSFRNHSALDLRLLLLSASAGPLVQSGRASEARVRALEARSLVDGMKQRGIQVAEGRVLKAEAIVLGAEGRGAESVRSAEKLLASLATDPDPQLSESLEVADALELMRTHAAGIDPAACSLAGERLVRLWGKLREVHPGLQLVRTRAARAAQLMASSCEWRPLEQRIARTSLPAIQETR